MRLLTICALLACTAICVVGSVSNAQAAQDIYATEVDNGATLAVQRDDTIIVSLQSNAGSTGYQWKLGTYPNNDLDFVTSRLLLDKYGPGFRRIGSNGHIQFLFRPKFISHMVTTPITIEKWAPGQSREKGDFPVETFQVSVLVLGCPVNAF